MRKGEEEIYDNSYEKEIEYFNESHFLGLNDIKCGDVLFFTLNVFNNDSKNSNFRSLARIIKSMFVSCISVTRYNDCQIGFLYSNAYGNRKDFEDWFCKVYDLASSRIIIMSGKRLRVRWFYDWANIMQWYTIFRKVFVPTEAFYYSSILYKYYSDYLDIIHQVVKNKVKLMVTLCDAHSIDSMVTQYCNNHGIKTATLEHGFMTASPVLSLSKSDYFLGYGQCILENALSVGMNEKKFIKVGMPQLIGTVIPKELIINSDKIIGIVCNGSSFSDEDVEMMKIAIEFADKHKYKIYVKLHPGSDIKEYPGELVEYIDKIYSTDISAIEFARLVQFSIISSSSLFIEYLLHMYPVLHYPSKIGTYNKEKWCEVNNSTELSEKIGYILNNSIEYYKIAYDALKYYTECEDVDSKYKCFFDKFINNSRENTNG